tara:strand:+ start:1739 stop:2074 length:336 start_codon:yes stop_codon:yes gene_type:complete
MAKFAHVDENNKLLGWYDDEVHNSIPEPKIKVSEEQHVKAIEKQHNYVESDGSTKLVEQALTSEQKIIEAKVYLSETDWYVIREADSGKEMPSDIKTKRAEARETISNLDK